MDFLDETDPYVIAEVGGNHGGDLDTAKRYVKAAAEADVDAVKFQLYSAESLIVEDEPPLPLAGDEYDTQFERFKELELHREEWEELIQFTEQFDVAFTASVFDTDWAEYVVGVSPFIKIASGDMTDLPLLRHVVDLGSPIVMSTGFATWEEIETVVAELPTDRLALLHCVGAYPSPDEAANLEMISTLADCFDVPIGYSDHTFGTTAAKAAVAKGARIVEKHFTLDKSREVGDHRLSANPTEMANLVEEIQRIVTMQGDRRRDECYPVETELREKMRRSLAMAQPVSEGDQVTAADLTALRPADGISPLRIDEVIGKTATTDLHEGEILRAEQLN